MDSSELTQHFNRYFEVIVADTKELRDEVFFIRHAVYCEELAYEPCRPDKRETDEYDTHSKHCLLFHKPSKRFVGCIRLIVSRDANTPLLPFQILCQDSLSDGLNSWIDSNHNRYGEISRLAIITEFRRRPGELSIPDGESDTAIQAAADERRRLPSMSLGLYLAATAVGLHEDLNGVVAVMEPRLARLLSRYGLIFTKAGETIEHRGKRAPFLITKEQLLESISPDMHLLLEQIYGKLCD